MQQVSYKLGAEIPRPTLPHISLSNSWLRPYTQRRHILHFASNAQHTEREMKKTRKKNVNINHHEEKEKKREKGLRCIEHSFNVANTTRTVCIGTYV